LAASYAVTKHTRPVYEASTKLFVNTASAASLTNSTLDTQSAVMLASAVADMVNSHREASEVLQIANVPLSTDGLLAEMKAGAATDTPIVTIDVRDTNPQLAARIADAAASAIIVFYRADQSMRYSGLKTTLQHQISGTTTQLASATRRLSTLDGSKPVNVAQISSVTTQINSLQSSLTALNTQLNTLVLSKAQSDSALTVIDHAQMPTSPVSPSMATNLLLALIFSVMVTGGIIAGAEYLDDSVRSPEWIEERLKLPVLAVVGKFRAKKHTTLVAEQPWDDNAEAFKTLRTNVQFIDVDQPPRTILVGSGNPSEGKSTVAANYAVAVAQAGKQVILVDSDLRHPTIHRFFGLEPSPGLTDYLIVPSLGLRVVQDTTIANLRVVCSGPIPPNPSELLGSHRMTELLQLVKEHSNLVILDSPPALMVTDPSVLAPHVDSVVLVVDGEKSKMRATQRTVQRFTMVGGKVLGVVLNRFDPRTGGYSRYNQSGNYKSGQGGDGDRGGAGKPGAVARVMAGLRRR
jgi:non-specific protein-tyrosine kinase